MSKQGHWIRQKPADHKHAWKIVGPHVLSSGAEIILYTCRFCESYFGMRTKTFYPALMASRKNSARVRRIMAVNFTGIPKAFKKEKA